MHLTLARGGACALTARTEKNASSILDPVGQHRQHRISRMRGVSLTIWLGASLATAVVLPGAPACTSASRCRSLVAQEVQTFEFCQKKHCSKRGAKAALKLAKELAPDGVVVVEADCSDTEHGCFDECTMGPNVRVGGEDGKILNGVKGAAAVAELLGVPCPQ